jgi:DNA-binding transcriptional MerR regulator
VAGVDPGVSSRVYNLAGMTQAIRIGELAQRAGTSPDTLRYYERVGLLPHPPRTPAGYRLYDSSVAERVAFIKKAQALGLTLEEIRDVLRIAAQGTAPCEHVRAALQRRLEDVDTRIRELESLRATLRRALSRNRRLPLATSCICGIIESGTTDQEK